MNKPARHRTLRCIKIMLPISLCLAATLCLVSCKSDPTPEPPSPAVAEAPLTTSIQGLQFASPYGIFTNGQPPVYILKEQPPAIEAEGARAWLQSALYVGGNLHVVVKIEDPSATETLQEEGTERPAERSVIEGAGIPGGRFIIDGIGMAAKTHNEYQYHWYRTDQQKLEPFEPEGTYQIEIPGFPEGFSVEFQKAAVFAEAGDIPGMTLKDGLGIMAVGEQTAEGIQITWHTWTDGRYTMQLAIPGPSFPTLICHTAEGEETGTYQRTVLSGDRYGIGQEILAALGGRTQDALVYDLPAGVEQGAYTLEFNKLQLNAREMTKWLKIPVPQEKTPVDQTLEFGDCSIRIISAEKENEPRAYTKNEAGEDILLPAVYLEVEVIMKDDTLLLSQVLAVQEEADPQDPASQQWAYPSYLNGHLSGVYAFYEEGEEEIQIRFENPSYKWLETLSVPVQMIR